MVEDKIMMNGKIKADAKFSTKKDRIIIQTDDEDVKVNYYCIRKSLYNYSIFMANNNGDKLLISSKPESKSFFKKILGGGGVIFYTSDEKKEILRIAELNKFVKYKDKEYDYTIIKDAYHWKFETEEFKLQINKGHGELLFSYRKPYQLQCIVCGIYLWTTYVYQSGP